MSEESRSAPERSAGGALARGLSRTIAKRLSGPLITAATAYLTRKGTEIWRDRIAPHVREKGGTRNAARDALETAAGKLGGRAGDTVRSLAQRLGEGTSKGPGVQKTAASDSEREEARRRRQQHREQRQRALGKSKSS